jgi:hypothetical protein
MNRFQQRAGRDAPTSRPARCPDLSRQGTPIIPHTQPARKQRGLTPISVALDDYCHQLAASMAAHGDCETAQAVLQMAAELARQEVQP